MPLPLVGVVQRLLGNTNVQAEQAQAMPRLSHRSELFGIPLIGSQHGLADEGSFFTAVNATVGTGIASVATGTTYSDTAALLTLQNKDTVGGKKLSLAYIKLIVSAVPTNSTSANFASSVDSLPNRYASGGTALIPNSVNMDSGIQSVVGPTGLNVGAVVTTARSSMGRTIARGAIRSQIPVLFDIYLFVFGNWEGAVCTSIGLTTASQIMIPHCPVVLGPGQTYALHEYEAARSGADSFECEIGWWER